MRSTLTYDQRQDLEAYFTGELAASMGIKSALGGQLDRLEMGLSQTFACSSTDSEPSDQQFMAVVQERHVRCLLAAMQKVDVGAYHTLRARYTPLPEGTRKGLESLGVMLGPCLRLCPSAKLRKLIRTSKFKKASTARREAWQELARIVGAANAALTAAHALYSCMDACEGARS